MEHAYAVPSHQIGKWAPTATGASTVEDALVQSLHVFVPSCVIVVAPDRKDPAEYAPFPSCQTPLFWLPQIRC